MDRAVTKALKSGGNKQNKLQKIWGCTLYHREDVPYAPDLSDLPDGFTPFRNKVESKSSVRAPLPRANSAGDAGARRRRAAGAVRSA